MIQYEWSIEERTYYDDGSFDCENHDFASSLAEYGHNQWAEIDGHNYTLVLIRRDWKPDFSNWTGMEVEPLMSENGVWILPEYFDGLDGNGTIRIPKRFHGELAKRQRQAKVPTN